MKSSEAVTAGHLLLFSTTTGYQLRMFAEAARQLGVRYTLATDRCDQMDDPWADGAIPVKYDDPAASAAQLAANAKFTGVMALGDRTTFLAALTAERLGIPFHPPHAVEASINKFLTKQRFQAAGLLVPEYTRHSVGDAPPSVNFPCVLKPIGLSGSQGVVRANNQQEFDAAFQRIRKLLSDPTLTHRADPRLSFIQVESYIPGKEFALEGAVTGGVLRVIALFDKPDPLEGPFFEETIYVTPSRADAATQDAICTAARRGVAALGLSQGPIHAEMRVNEEGVWLLEIAPRSIGGYCAKALRFQGGMSLEEFLLRHALGQDLSGLNPEPGASGVMMIPIPKDGIYKGVTGHEEVDDVIITAVPGQRVRMFPEANSYLGFIFARATTPEFVVRDLRAAHQKLTFDIATALL
ncbi:MAG: ATP-grasp domain-containing protein [Candidatus Solibacter usitatus]|nr:ATP-grasp domain-containing protein [Candidatus Solibacter usitatus]